MQMTYLTAALLISASATVGGSDCDKGKPVILSPNTKSVSGWLSTKGEWLLFLQRNISNYNPYSQDEDKKCISIVNDTGKDRSAFRRYNKKRVNITGYVMSYDSLSDPVGGQGLLSKKYFGDQVVENSCLRYYVFVAKTVELR